MNGLKIFGIILIVVGAIGLIYGGITYTSHKDVVDVGPMHLEVDQKSKLPITPIAGAVAVVIGGILVFAGGRRPSLGRIV